jgi:hypothetical protein
MVRGGRAKAGTTNKEGLRGWIAFVVRALARSGKTSHRPRAKARTTNREDHVAHPFVNFKRFSKGKAEGSQCVAKVF